MWMCGSKIFTAKPLRNQCFVYYIKIPLEPQAQIEKTARPLLRDEAELDVGQQRPRAIAEAHKTGGRRIVVGGDRPLDIVVDQAHSAAHPDQRVLELEGNVVLQVEIERPRGAMGTEDVVALEA